MSGSNQRRRALYRIDTIDTSGGRRTSARRRAMTTSSWARNTASQLEPRTEVKITSYIHWYLDFLRWRPAAVSLSRSSNMLRSLNVAWSAFGYTIDLSGISSALCPPLPFVTVEHVTLIQVHVAGARTSHVELNLSYHSSVCLQRLRLTVCALNQKPEHQ